MMKGKHSNSKQPGVSLIAPGGNFLKTMKICFSWPVGDVHLQLCSIKTMAAGVKELSCCKGEARHQGAQAFERT